jgi:hypothetical protein
MGDFYIYKETRAFILQTVVLSLCLLFGLIIFIPCMRIRYPAAKDLQYETCTYLSYEYKSVGKSSYQYHIRVKEYDEPLVIDNIVQRETNKELLASLRSGESVQISLADQKYFCLYEISARGGDILAYEDFLFRHRNNDRIGIVFGAIVSVVSFSLLVAGIIHYIKTGDALKGFS